VDRLFLDANILFSAAYRPDAGVTRLWLLAGPVLLTSDYAVEETRRNLSNPDQLERLNELLQTVQSSPATSLDPTLRADIQLPEKDWPILGGAVAARATHLITGDVRDFGPYFGTKLLGVMILRPADYLNSQGDPDH
jgi:predicted nucleic acid-binding protein